MRHIAAKEVLDSNFNEVVINIKFSRNCHKFHILTKIVILKVHLDLFRPTACFHPIINFIAVT